MVSQCSFNHISLTMDEIEYLFKYLKALEFSSLKYPVYPFLYLVVGFTLDL